MVEFQTYDYKIRFVQSNTAATAMVMLDACVTLVFTVTPI